VPESFKVLIKELQSLALDVRVLNDKGEEIQLSTLCNDEEPSVYANRADAALRDLDEDEEEELRKSFLIEDENGEVIDDGEEYEDSFEDEEVYEEDSLDDYDNDNN